MGRKKAKPAVETLEVPKSALTYANALGKVGSGAADLGKATGILALLATRDAVALGKTGIDKAVAAGNRRGTAESAARGTHTTRNRLIVGGIVVGLLAVGGVAFRWLRSQNEMPEPAAKPPSVRDVRTNGTAPVSRRPAGQDTSLN